MGQEAEVRTSFATRDKEQGGGAQNELDPHKVSVQQLSPVTTLPPSSRNLLNFLEAMFISLGTAWVPMSQDSLAVTSAESKRLGESQVTTPITDGVEQDPLLQHSRDCHAPSLLRTVPGLTAVLDCLSSRIQSKSQPQLLLPFLQWVPCIVMPNRI